MQDKVMLVLALRPRGNNWPLSFNAIEKRLAVAEWRRRQRIEGTRGSRGQPRHLKWLWFPRPYSVSWYLLLAPSSPVLADAIATLEALDKVRCSSIDGTGTPRRATSRHVADTYRRLKFDLRWGRRVTYQ